MELLDLGDDELLCIFKYVNHKSLLESMLVCKRFEDVIGSSPQFYKDKTLTLNDQFLEDPASEKIRRYFGSVECWNKSGQNFPRVLKIVEHLGPKLLKLIIGEAKMDDAKLVKLCNSANNIKELHFGFTEMEVADDCADRCKTLENLKTLGIFSDGFPATLVDAMPKEIQTIIYLNQMNCSPS